MIFFFSVTIASSDYPRTYTIWSQPTLGAASGWLPLKLALPPHSQSTANREESGGPADKTETANGPARLADEAPAAADSEKSESEA